MSRHKSNSVYAYLEASGVLEQGTPEEISAARKAYWRFYKARWRQQKRGIEKCFTISFSKEEERLLSAAAKETTVSRTKFIKLAVMQQLSGMHPVADPQLLRKVLQLLAMQYNTLTDAIEEGTVSAEFVEILMQKLSGIEQNIRNVLR